MGVGGQLHSLAALRPGKTRYPLYSRLGGPQGRSGRMRKNLATTGIRSPDRQSRSESLYRLSYSGPRTTCFYIKLLKPTGRVMHQHFNIQQLYALPTLYLCVLYLSENRQRLAPLTA